MIKLTKAVEIEDYEHILDEVAILKSTFQWGVSHGVRLEIGHEHRYWEYGMALKAFGLWLGANKIRSKLQYQHTRILDVGAGNGLLGPTLARSLFSNVTEVEPNTDVKISREICNNQLALSNCPQINWVNRSLFDYTPEKRFDVVFCISVIEHVEEDAAFLRALTSLLYSGGLLFMTTDVMPIMPRIGGGNYHFDNLRAHNYTMSNVQTMTAAIDRRGFRTFGDIDFQYHGDRVFDYSFASISMMRK